MANLISKIGVIGVGHLGQHHVKHLSNNNVISFSGIFDVDTDRANKIAVEYNCNAHDSLNDLLNNCDAVSIVTPTLTHAKIAEQCIMAGKHVFIEKPITKTVAEADRLLNLAAENNVLIQVGHIERLNPALIPLKNFELTSPAEQMIKSEMSDAGSTSNVSDDDVFTQEEATKSS